MANFTAKMPIRFTLAHGQKRFNTFTEGEKNVTIVLSSSGKGN